MTEPSQPGPLLRLFELLDDLDEQVRMLPTARALDGKGVQPRLAALVVEGLKQLLEGQSDGAAGLLAAVVEELQDRTISLEP